MQFTWHRAGWNTNKFLAAVLHPPDVSIHRPVEVKVTGEIVICYSGIDEQSRV